MKISIITINYNNSSGLERTIKSVVNQDYNDVEFIIIDGGSTDSSVNVIKQFKENISLWISEPDKGIYYAMNKGIERCTGEWVNFMNSGDTFFDNNIISTIFSYSHTADVLYGDNILEYNWGSIVLGPDELSKTKQKMVFGHQTSFTKSEILRKYKFDTEFELAADFKLFHTLYQEGYSFEYIPICISICDAKSGISKTAPIIAFKEDAIITGRINDKNWEVSFLCYKIRIFLRAIIVNLFPGDILKIIIKKNTLKNKLIKKVF